MKAETKEYMFEKKFGYSFGVDGFVTRSEDDPLRKAVVNHNHQRVETGGGRQSGDEVDGQLLKWAGAC